MAKIDHPVIDERSAIVDADHGRAPVPEVGDAHFRSKRKRAVGCRHGAASVDLSIGGAVAIKTGSIPTGFTSDDLHHIRYNLQLRLRELRGGGARTGLTSAGERVACSSGAWGSTTRSKGSSGSAPLTERKSLATTGRRAALPEIAPESVASVRRTRMHSGVAKVLELNAQFSAVGGPHQKRLLRT